MAYCLLKNRIFFIIQNSILLQMSVAEQAGLNLAWWHDLEARFSHDMHQFYLLYL